MSSSKPRSNGCLIVSLVAAAVFALVVIMAVLLLHRWDQSQIAVRIWARGGAVFTEHDAADETTSHADIQSVTMVLENHSLSDFKLIAACPGVKHLYLSQGRLTGTHWDSIAAMKNLELLELTHVEVGQDLSRLRMCRSLTNLALAGRSFEDKNVAAIKRLPGLRSVSISRTRITSLQCVANLENLKSLEVQYTPSITDDDLVHLQELQDLRSLRLTTLDIDGSGLKYLTKLRKLESLSLSKTHCTSEKVGPLIKGQNIRYLDLSRTQVDDSIMSLVSELSTLRQLHVESTQITGVGLQKLPSSLDLEWVSCGPPVKEEEVVRLKKRFPKAKVNWEEPLAFEYDEPMEPQPSDGDEEE